MSHVASTVPLHVAALPSPPFRLSFVVSFRRMRRAASYRLFARLMLPLRAGLPFLCALDIAARGHAFVAAYQNLLRLRPAHRVIGGSLDDLDDARCPAPRGFFFG